MGLVPIGTAAFHTNRPRVSTGLRGTVPFGTANQLQLGLLSN